MTSFKVGEGVGCFYTPVYNMGISAEQGGEERVRKFNLWLDLFETKKVFELFVTIKTLLPFICKGELALDN